MNIRTACGNDAAQISTLVRSLAHFYLDNPGDELPAWLSTTLTEEAFSARLTGIEYTSFVYEEKDSIIGYISIKKPNHLFHLFVSERFQGKGISRSLWEHVLTNGQYGAFTLRSSVFAIPVYKRFGFVESGPSGTKDGVSFQPMELRS